MLASRYWVVAFGRALCRFYAAAYVVFFTVVSPYRTLTSVLQSTLELFDVDTVRPVTSASVVSTEYVLPDIRANIFESPSKNIFYANLQILHLGTTSHRSLMSYNAVFSVVALV